MFFSGSRARSYRPHYGTALLMTMSSNSMGRKKYATHTYIKSSVVELVAARKVEHERHHHHCRRFLALISFM